MKRWEDWAHKGGTVSSTAALAGSLPVPSVTEIYEAHGDFVWASLHRLGVREADVPDMAQEVFVVVHRKLRTWNPETRIRTWLFGICLKVAAAYRRRAWFRRERPCEAVDVEASETPEDQTVRAEERARLREVLDALPPDRRATFMMFELEGNSCAEIAELFDVPVGTVHSRLHAARRDFKKSLKRVRAREEGRPR
ncbi:MAG: sigma-70 family RNA polymerase sigma factor [Myxococcota bacterium]